jgi:hypothetical protein
VPELPLSMIAVFEDPLVLVDVVGVGALVELAGANLIASTEVIQLPGAVATTLALLLKAYVPKSFHWAPFFC